MATLLTTPPIDAPRVTRHNRHETVLQVPVERVAEPCSDLFDSHPVRLDTMQVHTNRRTLLIDPNVADELSTHVQDDLDRARATRRDQVNLAPTTIRRFIHRPALDDLFGWVMFLVAVAGFAVAAGLGFELHPLFAAVLPSALVEFATAFVVLVTLAVVIGVPWAIGSRITRRRKNRYRAWQEWVDTLAVHDRNDLEGTIAAHDPSRVIDITDQVNPLTLAERTAIIDHLTPQVRRGLIEMTDDGLADEAWDQLLAAQHHRWIHEGEELSRQRQQADIARQERVHRAVVEPFENQ